MRRLFFSLAFLAFALTGSGQRSVDALFTSYADREGFVTITINGNLLKLARSLFDDDKKDEQCWPAEITTIRILAQEDENIKVANFYNMVEKELERKDYEEFMRIKEAGQDLVMLVRTAGRNFKEFLVVAGGEDNMLIQIKGNMTFKEAEKFSDRVKKDNGADLVNF